jgi:hypothetical protein
MGSRIIKRVLGRDFTPPSAPTGLTALALDPYRIKLDCNNALDGFADPGEAVTGIAAYQWQWSTDGVGWGSLADTAVSTYTHTGLQPSTLAYYRVRAMDLAGNVSGFSNVASATTLPVETANRPPVWNTSSIQVYAYAGQAVSQSIAGFASDPDGDTLEFTELPTAVLSQLGLTLSANGLLSGTIPAGIQPQTLVAQIGVSDAEYTVTLAGGLTITVADGASAQADWDARSRGPGVFWATNFAEWVRGIPGYVSQPVRNHPSGQLGRISTEIADVSQVPSGESDTIPSSKYIGDLGDGRGQVYLGTLPGVSGRVFTARTDWNFPVVRPSGGNSDLNLLPWAWVPLDYADAEEGTGLPNQRRGIAGTIGADSVLPFVDTTIDPALGIAKDNPANRPMIRHFYLQWIVYREEDWEFWCPRTWADPPMINGIKTNVRSTKDVFVNGGASGGQFAIGRQDNCGIIRAVYTDGGSFGGQIFTRRVLREDQDFAHPSIDDTTKPLPVSGDSVEPYLRRYGPTKQALRYGTSMRVDGAAISPTHRWYSPHEDFIGGVENYAFRNTLAYQGRNYPYGGFSLDGQKPLPDLGWSDYATSGIMRPRRPHVIEVMYTVQTSAPVNQTDRIPSQKTPQGPCFIACWAAPLGDEPVLLWQSGNGTGNSHYPALLPARALHRASGNLETTTADDFTIFKDQDNSTFEDRSNCGYMIVGALDGFPEPTASVFYALRANTGAGVKLEGPYVINPTNKAVDAGPMEGYGDYSVIGWARGELSGPSYRPADSGQNFQYVVEKTEYTGQIITVPNSYQDGAASVSAHVHKYTMLNPLPVVPRAREAGYLGDCFNQLFGPDALRPLGRTVSYGEIIFSMKPIPFPGHLGKALPMPWRN